MYFVSTPPVTSGLSATHQLAELRRLSAQYTDALRDLAELRGTGPLPSHAAAFARRDKTPLPLRGVRPPRRDKISATLARLTAVQQARSRFMDEHDLPTRETQ